MKVCPHCKLEKPLDAFYNDSSAKSGKSCWCKRCHCEDNQKYNKYRGEYQKEYFRRNRVRIRKLGRERRAKVKLVVLAHYGSNPNYPSCVGCGELRINCLSIDHVEGGGGVHLKSIGGHIYDWLKQHGFPTGFQTLCMNCQFLKEGNNWKEAAGN
jgi:hypothetical protein